MQKPNAELLRMRRQWFPAGTRVEVLHMDDVQAPPAGTLGTVQGVDDLGSILVSWDTGSSLSLIPEVDSFRVVKEESGDD